VEVDGQTPPMAPTTCTRDFQQPHHSTLPHHCQPILVDAGPPHRLASHPAILALGARRFSPRSGDGPLRDRFVPIDPPSRDRRGRHVPLSSNRPS